MNAQSDVQSEKSAGYELLDWVGMSQIQTAVRISPSSESNLSLPAYLDVGVDLSENHRGIHMSRLYRLHQEFILNQPLTNPQLSRFADQCLESHADLSRHFSCKLKLAWPVQTVSLRSNLSGFRNYPVEIIFEKSAAVESLWVQFEILYSSTCPQSAGLSMEILKSQTAEFDHLPATAHAQRSRAVVQAQVTEFDQKVIEELIARVEAALGTPVQTTVKKADEMRFAELNAQNLMFCEDAARKVSASLTQAPHVKGFSVYCEHQESLHPHNASSLKRFRYQAPQRLFFT